MLSPVRARTPPRRCGRGWATSRPSPWPAGRASTERCWCEETVTCVVQVAGKVRDRLEVPPDIAEDELRELALARSGGGRGRWAAARSGPWSSRAAEAGQHRPGLTPATVHRVAGRVAVVTDSTAYLPDGLADAAVGIRSCPLQVVLGGRSCDEGERTSRRPTSPTALSRLDAGEHLPADAGDVLPARTGRRCDGWRRRDRVAAPVRRAVRHLRLRADWPRRRSATDRSGSSTPGRSRWGSASRCSRRPRPPLPGQLARGRRTRPRSHAPSAPRRSSTWTRWSTCAAAAGSARRRRCSAPRWR